jgi:hypothetical protein
MSTADLIAPIIHETYGHGPMPDAFVKHLAWKIEADDFDSRGREYGIMIACWDWFSGGTTADATAQKIEAALNEKTA